VTATVQDPRCVLLTTDAVGGVWTFALDLARGLSQRGIEVVLASMGPRPSTTQEAQARAIPTLTLAVRECRLEWMDAPWRDVDSAGEWLRGVAEVTRCDLVHHNGYAHAALGFRAPVIVGAHSCVLSWFRAVKGHDAPAEWNIYRERVQRGLRAADLVIAPTTAMLRALEDCHGPLPRTRTIPNGRRIEVPPLARQDVILAAGRVWDEAKNIAALVEVAATLPWRTVIAGEARRADGTEVPLHPAEALGRLESEALAAWMARASIFVLPARYEPFGLSALEAALAGCALVLGDIPSLREVWGEAACFVPPDDREALRAALQRLISDPGERARLQVAARERAQSFTPEAMVERYLEAYRSVMRGGANGTPSRGGAACAS
jgi:glycosyltransferase involved in cell wall biosynthesis